MPTLVWVRRPDTESGGGAEAQEAATVPDPVDFAPFSAAPVQVALPALDKEADATFNAGQKKAVILASSKQGANHGKEKKRKPYRTEAAKAFKRRCPASGGKKKKRQTNRAKAATDARKTSKAKPKRDLPRGVYKLPAGNFEAKIRWGDKSRRIGTFDTPEQASAAFLSVKMNRGGANLSVVGADEVDAAFDAAKKKALEAMGGIVLKKKKSKASSERDLPQGIYTTSSGKFQAKISLGGKYRNIGSFDTLEQAIAEIMSVKKNCDDAKQSALGVDDINDIFNEAKKKVVGGVVRKHRSTKATSERSLPRGVYKRSSGKFQVRMGWGGKECTIGTFDTLEQATAAYKSVKKDYDDTDLSAFGDDEVNALFDAAKKKALESVGGVVSKKKSDRDLPIGVRKRPSGKFEAQIKWRGKNLHIGTFDTPELASAARVSVRRDLENGIPPSVCAEEADAIFDAAKKETVEAMGEEVRKRRKFMATGFPLHSGHHHPSFIDRHRLMTPGGWRPGAVVLSPQGLPVHAPLFDSAPHIKRNPLTDS